MTQVISILNLKGGVAKTTTTVALADTLAVNGKRVLVVDLDPQCDTSVMLLGGQNLTGLFAAQKTLAEVFIPGETPLSFEDIVENGVSNVRVGTRPVKTISLLAANMILADIQDDMTTLQISDHVLSKFLAPVIKGKKFDVILFDCPPNFGVFTRNAIQACDSYIIPAIPDFLSMQLGVHRTYTRVKAFFQGKTKGGPRLRAIVATKYQAKIALYDTVIDWLTTHKTFARYFVLPKIPQTTDLVNAAIWGPHVTLAQKYPAGLHKELVALATNLKLLP